ncbi:MAG: hypothetical protein OXF46_08755, partial [Rhodobacteraceae bacterium]|nr:hypothetical protein [Paracoccaceae bacterium]
MHRMPGDIMDRVLSNDRIGKSLTENYISLIIDITMAVVLLTAMFVVDVWLTIVIVSLFILLGILTSWLNSLKGSRREVLSREQG